MDGHLGSYADPLSLNRYTYCHNNPIRYRDPSGRSPEGNIQSAYNAWQGGYISYAQYASNVWLNGGTPVANPNGSGINFGPDQGADWMRAGSGKSFEEYWGYGPYGAALPKPVPKPEPPPVYTPPPATPPPAPAQKPTPTPPPESTTTITPSPMPEPTPSPLSGAPPVSEGVVEIWVNGEKISHAMIIRGGAWGNAEQIARILQLSFDPSHYKVKKTSDQIFICSVRELVAASDRNRSGTLKLEDYLSWWLDDLGMHVTVHEDQLNAPVTLYREGDTIYIRGSVVFSPNSYTTKYPGTNTSYAALALEGIHNHWHNQTVMINGKNVTIDTKITDVTYNYNRPANYFTINIVEYNPDPDSKASGEMIGGTNAWSIASRQTVNMFMKKQSGVSYRQPEFMTTAAHEFGHVLGIDDAYPDASIGRPDAGPPSHTRQHALDIVARYDMMHDPSTGRHVSGWDVAMALQSYTEGKWQYWGDYHYNDTVYRIASSIIDVWDCSSIRIR